MINRNRSNMKSDFFLPCYRITLQNQRSCFEVRNPLYFCCKHIQLIFSKSGWLILKDFDNQRLTHLGVLEEMLEHMICHFLVVNITHHESQYNGKLFCGIWTPWIAEYPGKSEFHPVIATKCRFTQQRGLFSWACTWMPGLRALWSLYQPSSSCTLEPWAPAHLSRPLNFILKIPVLLRATRCLAVASSCLVFTSADFSLRASAALPRPPCSWLMSPVPLRFPAALPQPWVQWSMPALLRLHLPARVRNTPCEQ